MNHFLTCMKAWSKDLSKQQKVLLLLLLVMVPLFAILINLSHRMPGMDYLGQFLRQKETAAGTVYTGGVEGERLTVTVTEDGGFTDVAFAAGEVYAQTYHVKMTARETVWDKGNALDGGMDVTIWDEAGEMVFQGRYDPNNGTLWNAAGEPDIGTFNIYVSSTASSFWEDFAPNAGSIVSFAQGRTVARGDWIFYALAVFLSVFAAISLIFPEELFSWRYRRYVKHPEPTEYAQGMIHISWYLFTGMALVTYGMALYQIP